MATIAVKCRFCGSTNSVKKHGTDNGAHPRYRTFQLDHTYKACQLGTKEQIVDLAMNNAGIRDTVRALHISINAVISTLKKLNPRQVTTLPLQHLQVHIFCEMDEM